MEALRDCGVLGAGVAPPVALTFTCTAYQLLTAYGRNVDVGDWFASFCLALGAPPGAGAESAGGRGKKKRRAPKKKRKMKTVERSVHGAAEDAAAEEDQPAVRLLRLLPAEAVATELYWYPLVAHNRWPIFQGHKYPLVAHNRWPILQGYWPPMVASRFPAPIMLLMTAGTRGIQTMTMTVSLAHAVARSPCRATWKGPPPTKDALALCALDV